MSANHAHFLGNLTRDPELRYTKSGKAVCSLTIACNRNFKGKDGSDKQTTTFVDVRAWDKSAETLSQYFKRGQEIYVSGHLVNDEWTDKQTSQKRSKIVVECDQWSFVGPKQSQQAAHSTPIARATSPATAGQQAPLPEEDEVPF